MYFFKDTEEQNYFSFINNLFTSRCILKLMKTPINELLWHIHFRSDKLREDMNPLIQHLYIH